MAKLDFSLGQDTILRDLECRLKKTIKIDKRAEIIIIKNLIINCWHELSNSKEIHFNKKGFDLEIHISESRKINIEVKSSRRKADYLLGVKGRKHGRNIELFGNTLKYKDIDLHSGLLKADFLIFAAEIEETNLERPFDFWILSRMDLANLFPKATIFIPSHVPTLMFSECLKTGFTDEFVSFKRGVFQIILPEYDFIKKKWKSSFPNEFKDTWCPLLDKEFECLRNTLLTNSNDFINQWHKIFIDQPITHKNPNFKKQNCDFYTESTTNKKCKDCQKIIKEATLL